MTFLFKPRKTSDAARRAFATVMVACQALVVVPIALQLSAMPAFADGGAVLERPTFDRDNDVILIPFRGMVPRIETESMDNGTRLTATFQGAQAHPSTPYKLGVFHPLVSRVEMTPLSEAGRVRVSVWLSSPGSLNVVPDTRRGVLRLQIGPAQAEAPVDLSSPVGPQPIGQAMAVPALPPARPPDPPPAVMRMQAPGAPVPVAVAMAPQAVPSLPPAGLGARSSNPLPGTPASGEYVYRKAIPAANGNDVTEVMVRTGTRSNVGVDRNVDTDAVVVNLHPPVGLPVQRPDGWERPLASEPWRQPVYRGESTFKPVAAVDSLVGFTLMSENAAKFGSNFSGAGATLYGGALHVPVGNAWNVRLAGESFGYTISSIQVPDAQMRRDEYFGDFAIEYLPIRRPWVLAAGIGYWARYLTTKTNVLAPPEPSVLFQPTLLWHGPTLDSRVYVPLGIEALALTGDVEVAPYMFGLSDPVSQALGNMYGYQGELGLKYSTRHFSVAAGYRHQGYATFNQAFSASRGGPEVSLVWRF
jgi:hypothetical protein